MLARNLLLNLVLSLLPLTYGVGQNTPQTATNPAALEYPLMLEKSVTAGKTPVGTKVEGKLLMATLVNGKVVPRGAVFSGQVTESTEKTKTEPSRISIVMDSAVWKQGSEALKVYLTAWYYPTVAEPGQPLQYGPTQPASRTWDGQGQYPDPNSKVYRPFPGSESTKDQGVPDTANPVTSNHRIAMKNVESQRNNDGALVLVSKRNNIKLDHFTVYVFSSGDLVALK